MFPFDDQIAYDDFRRHQATRSRRKALRLPCYRPQDDAEADCDDDDGEEHSTTRGVRVLDMSDGYSVVD